MATWTDNTGNLHTITIDVRKARQLKASCEIDLLQCLTEPNHIEAVLRQLNQVETLLAAVAICEQIPEGKLDAFFELFGGEQIEAASLALLKAITDFFPPRPKALLTAVVDKIQTAHATLGDRALAAAMSQLEQMDFTSVLERSAMAGTG